MPGKNDLERLARLIGRYGDTAVLDLVFSDVFGRTRERIFVQGEAADGAKIGQYSTRPTAIPIDSGPRALKPDKKGGDVRFFPGGYAQYRKTQGRQARFVDLRLSGTLRDSWLLERRGKDWVLGFVNLKQGEIATKNEKHFGKRVFALTPEEIKSIPDLLEYHAGGGTL